MDYINFLVAREIANEHMKTLEARQPAKVPKRDSTSWQVRFLLWVGKLLIKVGMNIQAREQWQM
jgi:hypothetical protein